MGSDHGATAFQRHDVSVDLDSCDWIVVVPIDQYHATDPSVPALLAATESACFKLNGFLWNGEADHLPDVDCVL
jgi:hypothetical protein